MDSLSSFFTYRSHKRNEAHSQIVEVKHILILQDGGDEYSLLVNLKRLYELQQSRSVPLESLYDDILMVLHNFRNLEDEVCK